MGISPILIQMEYVSRHKKTETIFCRKTRITKNEENLILDLKFEHNKRFKLSHPALLCFRSRKIQLRMNIGQKQQHIKPLVAS